MKKIAITGLNGVLGKYLVEPLAKNSQLVNLYHSQRIENSAIFEQYHCDLQNESSVITALEQANPDIIIHLAAATHIDVCEADAPNGVQGKVWQTNVLGTQYLANWAAKKNKYLILLSTESVFSGIKQRYDETSQPDPVSWYGTTKAIAEEVLQKAGGRSAIVRAVVAYYPDHNPATFFGLFRQKLEQGQPFVVVSDHFLTPTYIPDISQVLQKLQSEETEGIFHATPNSSVTPFQFAQTLANHFGYDKKMIQPITLESYLGPDRARLRTKHACLNSTLTQAKLMMSFTDLNQALSLL